MAVFVLLLHFYTVMVIEKKRHLAQSPRKYAILILRSNFSEKGTLPLPHTSWRLRRLDSARTEGGARPCPQLQLLDPPMGENCLYRYPKNDIDENFG